MIGREDGKEGFGYAHWNIDYHGLLAGSWINLRLIVKQVKIGYDTVAIVDYESILK